MITIFGAIMHLPIAYLIAVGAWPVAAILLLIFGLFDSLDGELARLTKRVSATGMVLDASTDRLKETFLYSGAVYYFAVHDMALWALVAAVALGASICVSYVKARGEIAVATSGRQKYSHETLNKKLFPSGLLPFEIRMALLIVGLIVGSFYLPAFLIVLALIAVGSLLTFVQRLYTIATVIK
jgi:phosphatidylglycerophosphate synthase